MRFVGDFGEVDGDSARDDDRRLVWMKAGDVSRIHITTWVANRARGRLRDRLDREVEFR